MKKWIVIVVFGFAFCAMETTAFAQGWGAAIRAWRRNNTVRFEVINGDASPAVPLPYAKLWFKRNVNDGTGNVYWRSYASCETNESGQCSVVLPRRYSTGGGGMETRYFYVAAPTDPGDLDEPANATNDPGNVAHYLNVGGDSLNLAGYLSRDQGDWSRSRQLRISGNNYNDLSNEE